MSARSVKKTVASAFGGATSFLGEDEAFAELVRSSGDAMIYKDLDGIVLAANHGATLLYGYAPSEILGHSIEIMYPSEEVAHERLRHRRVAAGDSISGYRCTRIRGDGTSVDVVMSLSPIRNHEGDVVGVASISRAPSESEVAETRMASMMDVAPDGIICLNATGEIVLFNDKVSELFGYSRDELSTMSVYSLLREDTPLTKDGLKAYFRLPVHGVRQSGLKLMGRRRDGTMFPIEAALGPHALGGDQLAVVVVRDVTAQREMERAILDNEAELRRIAEAAHLVFALVRLNPPSNLYVSQNCEDLLGLPPEEYLHSPLFFTSDVVHPDDRQRVASEFAEKIESGLPSRMEYRIAVPGRAVKWIRTFAQPILNLQGEVERLAVTIEDITGEQEMLERTRLAEREAREANLAKNEFLSRMSHELRTPLNAILGFGQLLERQLTDADQVASVEHVLKAGRHLLDLINDVLEFAKIEANEMTLSLEAVRIEEIVSEVMVMMRPIADSAKVELRSSGHSPMEWVMADRLRLRQVLLNLISNGIKYNRRSGFVEIGCEQLGEMVRITVRDNGQGISEKLQRRLFTPFDRLGAEASDVEGTGIGLSLTRSLVELMGGTIGVTSESGIGSNFSVTLPSANDAKLEADDSATTLSSGPDAGKDGTLLYIEDNIPNVFLMQHVLRLRPGWKVLHAAQGRLGVDMAMALLPDLVLLDVHLPDMPGAEVLSQLKDCPATAEIPVAILTADVSGRRRTQMMAGGARFFLTKPFVVDELLAVIDAVGNGG